MTSTTPSFPPTNTLPPKRQTPFDKPIVLRQSPRLSRAVVWAILGVTATTITWASLAQIEQVVTATGQLQPQGTVKEIQAPVDGVIQSVFVEDGDRVEQDQVLVTFDSDATEASQASLVNIQQSLQDENYLYQALLREDADIASLESRINSLALPREIAALARDRLSLLREVQVLQAQLGNARGTMSPEQNARLRAAQRESDARQTTAQLELEQLEQRLAQNRIQIADSRLQLDLERNILTDISERNTQALVKAEESLNIETDILKTIQPLVDVGAVARLQLERQRQQVNDRSQALIEQQSSGTISLTQQQQRVDNRQAEINQLLKEQARLQLDIRQARAELTNVSASDEKNLWERLDGTRQRLAITDADINKVMIDNNNRLSEISSQLSRTNQTLAYQRLGAPISGTVFDLQARPGFVPRSGQAEPLLKIVPDDALIAEVFVTNRDIGFVLERLQQSKNDNEAMFADIRIDSFPFSKFGDIEGEILSIGSDALPPDEIYPYYRFPVKVSLDEQSLRGLPLQSGMSVSVNIKIQEERSVLSLMTNLFSARVDDLKRLR